MAVIHSEDQPPEYSYYSDHAPFPDCYLLDDGVKHVVQWQTDRAEPGWYFIATYTGEPEAPTSYETHKRASRVGDQYFHPDTQCTPVTPQQTSTSLPHAPSAPSTQRIASYQGQSLTQQPLAAPQFTTAPPSNPTASSSQQNIPSQQQSTTMATSKPSEIRMGQPAVFNSD